jgi:hypothetical protein
MPAVVVGRVEEVDALVVCAIHDRVRVWLVGHRAEIHGAEAEAADREPGAAERGEIHEPRMPHAPSLDKFLSDKI